VRERLSGLVSRRVWAALAVTSIALTTAPAAQQAAQSPPPSGRRFALLVGVTEFIAPAMKKHNLQGPANDVALFRTLLAGDAFRVPAAGIVSLAGLPNDEAARPTRSNIEREFRRLRDVAGAGDHVVVLLAGHGSQQPADPDPADEEPDGLDEIFLPADATDWDQSSSRVANAIVDDDIRQWVTAIRNKGAVVWVIVDACHSGTITRAGTSATRERGIPVETLIPAPALATARRNVAPSSINGSARPRAFELSNAAADIVALYAADVREGTPELPMPDRNGPVHGLFTYTLARVLTEHTEPMTYRDLVQRVIDRYQAEGFSPTPALEGAGVDRNVLGERVARDRPAFVIEAQSGADRWTLAAGSIHGLTRGSILEVFSPAGSAGAATPLGHMRVVNVRPTTAVVEPIPFANVQAPPAALVVSGSRARVKHHEFGTLRLRVALQRATGPSDRPEDAFTVVPSGGPPALERALTSLQTLSQGLAERVTSSDADWFVRVSANRVILTPAGNGLSDATPQRVAALEPAKRFDVGAADEEELPNALADRLRRIAGAANLARLSSYVDPDAGLQIGVLRYEKDALTSRPLLAGSGEPSVKAGERLQFIVRNTGKLPLDVTLVYVDANFGIWPLFPQTGSELDNRLDPGRERALEPVGISADPLGWESVVAIGVESTPRHENFLLLAQAPLADVRGSSGWPASPVRTLLEAAVFGTRAARGSAEDDRGRFAITQTWFRVELPEK